MFDKNRHFLPAYFFAALIFIFSSTAQGPLERFKSLHKLLRLLLSDYALHFLAFGIFAALLCFGFYKKHSFLPYVRIGLISLGFGLFIEIYQIILPYRYFSFNDLISDFIGTTLALFLFGIFMKNWGRSKSIKE